MSDTQKNYRIKQTINGPNQKVTIPCPGASAAVVTVVGNFTGFLSSVGGTNTTDGGRLLFKSGVGSIGTNTIEGKGQSINREYRVILGGDRYTVQSDATFTGNVSIEIVYSDDTNLVFINGPVHNAEEEAIRNKQGFLASTGTITVTTGNVLGCILKNPIDSGNNLFIRRRLFSNNRSAGDANLEYIAYSNPTRTFSNVRNGINLKAGGPVSAAVFEFENVSQASLNMGGIVGSGEILPNGMPYSRELDFILEPGKNLGFSINGDGNAVINSARFSITLEWYEETVN